MDAHPISEIPPPIKTIYENLFESAPNPSAVFDLQGCCFLVNRAFANQLGYKRDDLLEGRVLFRDLFPNPQTAVELFEQIQTRQVVRRAEINLKAKDAHVLSVLLWGRLLQHEEETYHEVLFVDLSKQKALQRAMRRAHHRITSLIENLTAGLFLTAPSGEITDINTALANLLGVEKSTLLGQPYQDLFARLIAISTEPEVVQQWLGTAARAVIQKPGVEFTVQDETLRHLEINFFPVWDEEGRPLGWGGLLQDITELREQTNWKFELLSILAHDLRAPLATLKGQVTALLANYPYWSEDMAVEFLEAINRGVDTLTHEVDQNLALTRVEAGRLGLRPEAVSPASLVKNALERSAGRLEDIPIQWEVGDALPDVRADPARVEEVLVNLLENAARYAPAGTAITIKGEHIDNWVKLSVRDRGPGVPVDKQKTVFNKYVRADEHIQEGIGLGLYISRKIVEAHGGRIGVQSPPSDEETGAEFTFTLPVMPAVNPQPSSPSPVKFPAPATGQRILVVEDEADFQTVLGVLLAEEGYRVEFASNGQASIDIVQADPPDLVLLDWRLPGVDGLAVCRYIRRWSGVPIIMVTSRISQEDILAAFDAGADDYITKPFMGEELKARVRALLRRGESAVDVPSRRQFASEGLLIDFDTRSVWRDGQIVELTATEFDLLEVLVNHPRQVLTYARLIDHVWESGEDGTRHALSVHISRLRKKIEKKPRDPRFLHTKWGVGYMFTP